MKGNVITVESGHLKISLRNRDGVVVAHALASVEDRAEVEKITWTLSKQGYVVGREKISQRVVKMNRFLMFGSAHNQVLVDHRDRNKLNNQRSNLRQCTTAENARNTSLAANNSSGAKGVSKSFTGTRWRARIWNGRKEKHLGVFDTIKQASAAYDAAALALHGEFASPNAEPCVVIAVREVEGEPA